MLGVIAFAIGASTGSFINVVVDRLPRGQSLVEPGSHCPECNTPLRAIDLIPIVSYIWLRGRCRYCGAHIPARLLGVEILCASLFTLTYALYGLGLAFAILAVIITFLLAMALIDLEHQLILNKMLIPAAVAAAALAPFWPALGFVRPFFGLGEVAGSLANASVAGVGGFLFFLIIYLVYPAGMGEGDVKLTGVLGVLLGFPNIVMTVWLSAVLGGVVGIYLLASGKKSRKDPIPFGLFLAMGALIALLFGERLLSWYQVITAQMGTAST